MHFYKTCITTVLIATTLLTWVVQVSAINSATSNVSLTILPGLVCKLNILVHPEKRIPRTGNWGTLLIVYIYQGDQKIASSQARSDDSGRATFDFCSQNLNFTPGQYNFAVKGLSHLCKYFENVQSFENDTFDTDLTVGGKVLLAGETSNVFDDKINSLDASTQIRAFYSLNDEKNDLNREGKVNSLDFSNTVYNFYGLGDNKCK
jgi:hypothetical protein